MADALQLGSSGFAGAHWGSITQRRGMAYAQQLKLNIDRQSPMIFELQIADQLREKIVGGELRKGQKLPSTRSLSKRCGVARALVVSAYQRLLEEGYLQTYVGTGTFVRMDTSCGDH